MACFFRIEIIADASTRDQQRQPHLPLEQMDPAEAGLLLSFSALEYRGSKNVVVAQSSIGRLSAKFLRFLRGHQPVRFGDVKA